MSEHILMSDVVKTIKGKNRKRAIEIRDEIIDSIKPIKKKIEEAEKWDECIIVAIYIRKWNDIWVNYVCSEVIASTRTTQDEIIAKDFFNKILDWWVEDI